MVIIQIVQRKNPLLVCLLALGKPNIGKEYMAHLRKEILFYLNIIVLIVPLILGLFEHVSMCKKEMMVHLLLRRKKPTVMMEL